MPRRVRLFAVSPTACLAGSSGCYTVRADIQQHASPCGCHVPAFSLWRAGLSHFDLTPVASLQFGVKQGLEPRYPRLKRPMLYQLSYSLFLHQERDQWFRQLLTDKMPLLECLSRAGTRPIFEAPSYRHRYTATSQSAQRPHLRLGLTALPFTVRTDRLGVDGTPAPPVVFAHPGSRNVAARPVRVRSFPLGLLHQSVRRFGQRTTLFRGSVRLA